MINKKSFAGLPNCFELSNSAVQLIFTTDVGPRILKYNLRDQPNIFAELPDSVLHTTIGVWHPRGGHRLWVAPEVMPETYYPDNDPVQYEIVNDFQVRLIAPVERVTGIQKELKITLDKNSSEVRIEHTITNRADEIKEVAPWALTIMRSGGTAILPQEPFRSHDEYLLPARPMVLWHFTNIHDSRWKFGTKYILLQTDETLREPQKIGIFNKQGWAAYQVGGALFIKRFEFQIDAKYPDYGSNNEVYTAGSFMEMETLGPVAGLRSKESQTHLEIWELYDCVRPNWSDESQIDKMLGVTLQPS